MNGATLSDHMYQNKPINIQIDMLLWGSNPYTRGQAGSCYTLIPVKWGGQGNNGGYHWNYAYAFLRYKDRDGNIGTLRSDAIAGCWNNVTDKTVAGQD